jgi:hypothetical protein
MVGITKGDLECLGWEALDKAAVRWEGVGWGGRVGELEVGVGGRHGGYWGAASRGRQRREDRRVGREPGVHQEHVQRRVFDESFSKCKWQLTEVTNNTRDNSLTERSNNRGCSGARVSFRDGLAERFDDLRSANRAAGSAGPRARTAPGVRRVVQQMQMVVHRVHPRSRSAPGTA